MEDVTRVTRQFGADGLPALPNPGNPADAEQLAQMQAALGRDPALSGVAPQVPWQQGGYQPRGPAIDPSQVFAPGQQATAAWHPAAQQTPQVPQEPLAPAGRPDADGIADALLETLPREMPEEQREQAARVIRQLDAVNMEEVQQPRYVKVAFTEWIERALTAYDGTPVMNPTTQRPYTQRVRLPRVALIDINVPTSVFNDVVALAPRLQEGAQGDRLAAMAEGVLAGWRITEPDMDLARLMAGLDFAKIARLFTLFFESQIRLLGLRAAPAESGS